MPPLDPTAPPLSMFEFWPGLLFYLPVWAWVLWLAVRHGGLRLPLISNPSLPAGGLFGESKSQVLSLVGGDSRRWVAPWIALERSRAPARFDLAAAQAALREAGLALPLVAKPDLGCRGAGVRPVRTEAELADYLAAFPAGERLVLQELVDWEGEAGVLYTRLPGRRRGHIWSLTLKYFPHVTGDGHRTLRQLIADDARAGLVEHLYLPRHAGRLDWVVPAGERFRLCFAGSHSKGAIFRDGTHLVTRAMRARFDAIADDIPEFWFGRFDVRFEDIEALRRGEAFRIVEVNGAGAEATHIWDSRMTLPGAYRALFRQWSLLFRIGAANRARGHRPESLRDFLARRRRERRATALYPLTA
jgi:hypothetical protein